MVATPGQVHPPQGPQPAPSLDRWPPGSTSYVRPGDVSQPRPAHANAASDTSPFVHPATVRSPALPFVARRALHMHSVGGAIARFSALKP
jgi:hypothetical protein